MISSSQISSHTDGEREGVSHWHETDRMGTMGTSFDNSITPVVIGERVNGARQQAASSISLLCCRIRRRARKKRVNLK